MDRRVFLIVLLVGIVAGVVLFGQFVATNFGSLKGLILPPSKKVTEDVLNEESLFVLPDGFSFSIFASDIKGPRVLHRGPSGELLVTLTKEGQVVALLDADADGVSDVSTTVLRGVNNPHGITHRCFLDMLGVEEMCELYVAEEDKVIAYDYDRATFSAVQNRILVTLPEGGGHYTRTLLQHPDGERLLVSVGSSCNVCIEEDERRATILSVPYNGSGYTRFATGLRNSVFLTLHPVTGDVWVSEMGRDWLGDELPPDEINIVKEGGNYGWPICYGKNIHDTEYDKNTYIRDPCTLPFEQPAHIDISAHSAPLGLAFIPEEGWPEDMWFDLLVAYHGSWNRSIPTGYKIMKFDLTEKGEYKSEDDFITGWIVGENEGGVLGRPVDILVEPGGVAYISDDRADVIYRLMYDRGGE
jgi:glucose/arabinose dehydrogenase